MSSTRCSLIARIAGTSVALSLLGLLTDPVFGQESRTVPSTETCPECRIRLRRVLKIGDRDGPGTIGRPQSVARDTRGRVYVVSEEEMDLIKTFDGSGHYLGSIGRGGEGPGEFRSIGVLAVGPGDTLHVFDDRIGRHSVFSPIGQFVRSSRFSGSVRDLAFLADQRLGLSARVTTRAALGYPLHILASSGEIALSFGSEDGGFLPEMFYSFQRFVTPDPSGGMWVSHHLQYVLEHWNGEGELLGQVTREADWFPPQSMQVNTTPDQPMHPAIEEIHLDRMGRLWVLIRVNPEGYERGLGDPIGTMYGVVYSIRDLDELFATRIEVLDLDSGELITADESDELLMWFISDQEVVSYKEDDGGVPRITIWTIEVTK